MSDLGGTLGLWAGFSILTGTEICVLMFHFIKLIVTLMCGKSNRDDKEDKKSDDGEKTSEKMAICDDADATTV